MLVKFVYTGQIENKVKDTWDPLVGTIHCKGVKRNYACYMQHVCSSQLEMEQLTDVHRIASNWQPQLINHYLKDVLAPHQHQNESVSIHIFCFYLLWICTCENFSSTPTICT